jgi:UDP-N-acetylglucosamine 4,6-dehydratase/5-epimerase
MKILITGGTGSVGQALAVALTPQHEITIFSRNEKSQVEMHVVHPEYKYVIGDIRDSHSVCNAIKDHHLVYHLAALKHIDICERQPMEAIKTNINGTANVFQACKHYGVQMINMSSDKAANPLNVYGRTKRLAEDIVQGYALTLRSGNIIGSSGSLVPNMIKRIQTTNEVQLTDSAMTRFFITLKDIVDVLVKCQAYPLDGVYIPNGMKSFYIKDVLQMLIKKYGDKTTKMNITGTRPGEQLREYLNASDEHLVLNMSWEGMCEVQREGGKRISSDDRLGTLDELVKMFIE